MENGEDSEEEQEDNQEEEKHKEDHDGEDEDDLDEEDEEGVGTRQILIFSSTRLFGAAVRPGGGPSGRRCRAEVHRRAPQAGAGIPFLVVRPLFSC